MDESMRDVRTERDPEQATSSAEPATDSELRSVNQASYVYGVVRAGRQLAFSHPPVGQPERPIRLVEVDDVAAIVSDVPSADVRASRETLTAHSGVLADALAGSPVLPMRFGVVLPDDDAVREHVIRPNYGELDRLLDDMDGRVELDVKAFYERDVLLREVIAENRDVARLREVTRRLPADATYYQRIELGQLVAAAIETKRQNDARAILTRLEPLAVATESDSNVAERVALKAAFLVDRGRLSEFDSALEEIAGELAGRMRFKSVGPLPPHSFVSLSRPVDGVRA